MWFDGNGGTLLKIFPIVLDAAIVIGVIVF